MIDLTPLDVRNKRGDFTKIMRGYQPDAVDHFLELVAERLEALIRENLKLRERTMSLQDQVSQQAEREQAVQNALVTAQELRADIQAQSQREAENIVKEAETESKRLVAEAETEVRRLLMEADEEVRNRLRGIERRVDQAHGTLEGLERSRARFLKEYRGLLERELDLVRGEEERSSASDELDVAPSTRVGPLAAAVPTEAPPEEEEAFTESADAAEEPDDEPTATDELDTPNAEAGSTSIEPPSSDEEEVAEVAEVADVAAFGDVDDADSSDADDATFGEPVAEALAAAPFLPELDGVPIPTSVPDDLIVDPTSTPAPDPDPAEFLSAARPSAPSDPPTSLTDPADVMASMGAADAAETPEAPPLEPLSDAPEVFDLPDHFGRKSAFDSTEVVREAAERLQAPIDVDELSPDPATVEYELMAEAADSDTPAEVHPDDGNRAFPDVPDLETVLAEAGIEEVVPPPVDRSPPPPNVPGTRPDNLIRFDPDHKRPNDPGR